MMRVPFLDLKPAYRELSIEISRALARVSESGQYLFGPETEAFEREFADFIGVRHCIAVGSGLDALTIALHAYGIHRGDDVLVPSNTFIATWMAVSAVGARPIPVEPDPRSFNITADSLRRALTPQARAVIPVHLYGRPCDMDDLRAWARAHSLLVIEDAAQAHGAAINNFRTGNMGHAGCWSFYPGKNLGAFGDAGAITTNDTAIAEMCRTIRNYGSSEKYHHEQMGLNSRMSETDAAILRVKLRVLDQWNRRRHVLALQYRDSLSDLPLLLPDLPRLGVPSWHLFVVQTPDRDRMRQYLQDQGIDTQIHYPVPPHRQPVYAVNYSSDACPVADALSANILSLPMGPHLTAAQVHRVSDVIHQYYDQEGAPHAGISVPS